MQLLGEVGCCDSRNQNKIREREAHDPNVVRVATILNMVPSRHDQFNEGIAMSHALAATAFAFRFLPPICRSRWVRSFDLSRSPSVLFPIVGCATRLAEAVLKEAGKRQMIPDHGLRMS